MAGAMVDLGQLPAALALVVQEALKRAVDERWAERIWERDASVWTSDDAIAQLISNRLGWLDLPSHFAERTEILTAFAAAVRDEGFSAAVVCGMGGSSLAPEVLARALPLGPLGMPVRVLDSTAPQAVRELSKAFDPATTLYLIASKSGTTTETLAFMAHFWQLEDDIHGAIPQGDAGRHFVAITDPSPSLDAIPHHDLLREQFINPADVGGRYSALSYVGLVPGALMGINLDALIEGASEMAAECRRPGADNPGLALGVALGALARAGRDKLTLVIEPRYAALGPWIEQLVAESTGKHGVGIVPIEGEALGAPDAYGDDRVFVRLGGAADESLKRLAAAGQPVMSIELGDAERALGAEFFRWEFATAVAGAVLGVNPFDEPNVTESKDNTKAVLEQFRSTGVLPRPEPIATDGPLSLSGDEPLSLTARDDELTDALRRHLGRAPSGGYYAVQAYLARSAEHEAALRGLATLLRNHTRRAVTIGFGPRFLHSTGQLHKGGAPLGCFIQLTAEHTADMPIAGWAETFATLIDAQAAGDMMALENHDLPVARISLSADPDAGLAALHRHMTAALKRPLGN